MKYAIASISLLGFIMACSDTSKFKGTAPRAVVGQEDGDATPAPIVPDEGPAVDTDEPEPEPEPEPDPVVIDKPVVTVPPDKDFQDCATGGQSLPIVAEVYALPVNTPTVEDYKKVGPKSSTVCLANYDIPVRPFSNGFPGSPELKTWFALHTHAKIKVPVSGAYEFELHADDGAVLRIDGNVVVDNDGIHGYITKRSDVVELTAGEHSIVIDWYQGPPEDLGLQLKWKPQGSQDFVIVPSSAFVRD